MSAFKDNMNIQNIPKMIIPKTVNGTMKSFKDFTMYRNSGQTMIPSPVGFRTRYSRDGPVYFGNLRVGNISDLFRYIMT